MTHHIALYGRGGVGKTTLAINISASLVEAGFTVLLVGCDPDGDSCSLLQGGFPIPSVQDQIRRQVVLTRENVVHSGFKGIGCIELGGSVDMSGPLHELLRLQIVEQLDPDFVVYDISGDSLSETLQSVIRQTVISRLFVVTTADYTSLRAVNEVFAFLERHNAGNRGPLPMGGLILNSIASSFEEAFVNDFAFHTNARTIGKVPRSQVIRQSELCGKTVIEFSPQSNQSYYYRRLANQIVDATGTIYSGNIPQPMSEKRLRAWSLEWADRIYALENGLVSDGASI